MSKKKKSRPSQQYQNNGWVYAYKKWLLFMTFFVFFGNVEGQSICKESVLAAAYHELIGLDSLYRLKLDLSDYYMLGIDSNANFVIDTFDKQLLPSMRLDEPSLIRILQMDTLFIYPMCKSTKIIDSVFCRNNGMGVFMFSTESSLDSVLDCNNAILLYAFEKKRNVYRVAFSDLNKRQLISMEIKPLRKRKYSIKSRVLRNEKCIDL